MRLHASRQTGFAAYAYYNSEIVSSPCKDVRGLVMLSMS